MDIEKIYIIDAETLERLIDGILILVFRGPELRRQEDILTCNATLFDPSADYRTFDTVVKCDEFHFDFLVII